MKKGYSTRRITCRLLTLLLFAIVGVGSAANQVNGASIAGVNNPLQNAKVDLFDYFFKKNASDQKQTGGTTQIRKHLLYNMCSDRFVKIIRKGRKGVNARGKMKSKTMDFSKLIFESTPRGTIKIFGEHSDYHICFNKKGKLIARTNGKKKNCEFIEEYSKDNDSATLYKSADIRHTWYIGFNKDGRPLKGTSINKSSKQKCFKFQKIHQRTTSDCKSDNGPKGVNFCDIKIWNMLKIDGSAHKKRHSKHHSSRRKG